MLTSKEITANRIVAHTTLQALDPKEPTTLQQVAKSLLDPKINITAPETFVSTFATQTLLKLWAQGRNIPRSQAFREHCVNNTVAFLAKKIAAPDDPR